MIISNMKTNMMMSIDHELAHKLREQGNISQTVNDLLRSHLFGSDTKEGIQKLIKEKEQIANDALKDIELLKTKLKDADKPVIRYT